MRNLYPCLILLIVLSCSKENTDSIPPSLTIISPTPYQHFALGDRLTINAIASDNVQVQNINLRIIDSLIFTIQPTSSIRTQEITVNKKDYQLDGFLDIGINFKTTWKFTLTATDQHGNETIKEVSVLVN